MNISTFGVLDPLRQKYDCYVNDIQGLLKLTGGLPFANWTEDVHAIEIQDFTSWFPQDENRIAIYGANDQQGLSYSDLHDQIKACPSYNDRTTVALLLPLDLRPEMAVALVSLLSQPLVCVAPLDYNMPEGKMLEAFEQLGCTGIVTTATLLQSLKSNVALSSMKDVRIIESTGTKAGAISWTILEQTRTCRQSAETSVSVDQPRMLLRTSGTTAKPKVVALRASHLLHSGASLGFGLKLSSEDVSCCAMPLFHIGGIAGALLCVLLSGSSVIMMPGNFDPQAFLDRLDPSCGAAAPTWYYAAPTMHQALILTAKAQGSTYVPNKLRLIRSAAAHLPHEIAMDLANLFHTSVFPTYGMSECMPITIPLDPIVRNRKSNVLDSVGSPAACSISIVNDVGEPLPYGEIGEIAVSGPGAIESYVGVSSGATHTANGFLKTGDVGCLDSQGNLFIKGRSKEMIKRGGEQIWPNEVDRVVLGVPGVKTAVTFAVPNELWGEEVAVAVVLDKSALDGEMHTKQLIIDTCKKELDQFAVPRQIIVVESTELPKGATGKYLRTRMADHLGVKSADTSAILAFKGIGTTTQRDAFIGKEAASVKPSQALNGTRFVTACFVVLTHIGFFPSIELTKIQSFSMSMPIFIFLVGFQMTCNVQIDTLGSWSSFVGSKIGSMHALFVLSHILALPSYLMFHFGLTGYTNFPSKLRIVTTQLLTGMLGYYDGNLGSTWFQSVVYKFIILFPWLDRLLRGLSDKSLLKWGAAMVLASIIIPSSLFAIDHRSLHYTFVTWFPNLISAMIAGHFFKRFGPAQAKDSFYSVSIFQKPQFWGVVTDTMSVFFLLILVAVALSPNCLNVEVDVYEEMRPNDLEYKVEIFDEEELVWACNVTWDEYVHYVHGDEGCWATLGRWEVEITHVFWDYRLGSPLVMIWLYGLAFGQGITANIMQSRLLQFLAPLSYPVYLLHIPIARYYWLVTRGFEAKQWWSMTGDYPVPVDFHEMLLIFGVSILLGYFIDRYILPHVIPYTVNIGVFVCQILSNWLGISSKMSSVGTGASVYDQVQHVVKALSGVDVSLSSSLDSLGLDSLGATAFLGTLRASLPTAKRLSLQKLVAFETVGDLVDFLSENECSTTCVGNQEGNIWNDTIPALDYSFSDSPDDSFSDSLQSSFSEEFRLKEGNKHQ